MTIPRVFAGTAVLVLVSAVACNRPQASREQAAEQVKSLVLSVLLVAVIMILLFRSWRIGCLAMIPAGIPVLLFFGLMGWSGLPLNVNTSVIASIAIGIAVDNCVHYLVHFRKYPGRGASASEIAPQLMARRK